MNCGLIYLRMNVEQKLLPSQGDLNLVMSDQSHVVVPDYSIYLKVYGCCYDDEPVALVYVEELKEAA